MELTKEDKVNMMKSVKFGFSCIKTLEVFKVESEDSLRLGIQSCIDELFRQSIIATEVIARETTEDEFMEIMEIVG